MTDAPIRVEVWCSACDGEATLPGPQGTMPCNCVGGVVSVLAHPGSLTEAMMQLAAAVVACEDLRINLRLEETPLDDWPLEWVELSSSAFKRADAALARVRKIKGE